jgi:hypothetical protein
MMVCAVMSRNSSTENTLEASTTHIPACICRPVDFSPASTDSVVRCQKGNERLWEWAVQEVAASSRQSSLNSQIKALAGSADPSAAAVRAWPYLRVTVVLGCAEVEHHTQAHNEAKGTLQNTPHTHKAKKHTLLNAKCGSAFANDHTTANALVLVRSPKLSAVGLR